jgi:uncharacterized membrane protein
MIRRLSQGCMYAAVLLLLFASAAFSQNGSYSFQFTPVDYQGATSTYASGINIDGTIVGSFYAGGHDIGFEKTVAGFTKIVNPFSADTHPYAISDYGVIVGSTIGISFVRQNSNLFALFIYPDFDNPAGSYTNLFGVNAAGEMVGSYRESNYPNTTHSYLCTSGHFATHSSYDIYKCDSSIAIEYPGALWTSALGMNNNGDIVGIYRLPGATYPVYDRGFLYVRSTGTYWPIDFPGTPTSTYPRGINNKGQIVGDYLDGIYRRGFLKDGSVFVSFDHPNAGLTTQPNGINDNGVIVGSYGDSSYQWRGFLATFTPPTSEPIARTLAIKRTEDYAGNFISFGFSLYGDTPQYFDYLILKSPSGITLADSRYDYFSGVPGSGYELYRGHYTSVETGHYTVEKWYQGSPQVFILPYEVKSSDIPGATSHITYPTPGKIIGPSVTFTWDPFPLQGNENALYYIEVYDSQGFNQLQQVGQALQATFSLPPQSYTANLFAAGVTDVVVNGGTSAEYTFRYYRQGISNLQFQVVGCATDVSSQVTVTRGGFQLNRITGRYVQSLTLMNASMSAIQGPVSLVLDNLSSNATLFNKSGVTICSAPLNSPYINIAIGSDIILSPGEAAAVKLEFTNPLNKSITYATRLLAGTNSK